MSHISDLRGDVAIRESTASSNSSRESSPNLNPSVKKRPFLPDSDDDDLDIAPSIDVDIGSPQQQPVIRKPLAFSNLSTGNINVYEASVDAAKPNTFLPGQEVHSTAIRHSTPSLSPDPMGDPMPSPSPGPTSSSSTPAIPSPQMSANTSVEKTTSSKGTRKPRTTKRAKHSDDLSFSTGRFRISQYSSTPSETPPLHHGQGPYSSMYRHKPGPFIEVNTPEPIPPTIQIPQQQPTPQPPSPVSSRISQAQTAWKMHEDHIASQSRTSNRATGRAKPSQVSHPNESLIAQDVVHLYPAPTRQDLPSTVPMQGNPESSYRATRGGYLMGQAPVPSSEDSGSHYPRRYEAEYPPGYRPSFPSQHHPGQREPVISPPSGSLPIAKGKEREIPSQIESSRLEQHLAEKQRGPTRLVTLLIEDKRVNPRDHLLAEVNIHCWSGPSMADLWCDAKELSEALQASASRIDGPAKVFTKRGDYRQCFLRVGNDQVNHCSSMNIKLLPDRTVPITIELYEDPTMRAALPSPNTSHDWRSTWHTGQHHDSGRYHAETSRSRHGGHSSPEYFPDSRRTSWKGPYSDNRDSRYDTHPISRQSSNQARRTHVPMSDSSEDEVPQSRPSLNPGSARIILADKMEQLIKSDLYFERYVSFWNTTKYSSILRACETVQKLRNKYRGQQVQISPQNVHIITEIDVVRILGAKESPEEFIREVDDTLRLLSAYGENGTRNEEPAVLEILRLEDEVLAPRSQLRTLLRLLRDVDKHWNEEHRDSQSD